MAIANTTPPMAGASMPAARPDAARRVQSHRLPLRARRDPTSGFILVPVLWILALLALVAGLLSRHAATDIRANANVIQRAEGGAMVDGIARLALRYAMAVQADGTSLGPFKLDGTPVSCSAGRFVAHLSIASAAGLVDLNTAPRDTLEQLFAAVAAPNPSALAAAVIDFRDNDDDRSMDGAEAEEYAAAGLRHGPKNAPFASVGELDQVLGMTPEIFARVRPFVTIRSGLLSPDPTYASRRMLAMRFPTDLPDQQRLRYLRVRVSVHAAGSVRTYTREATLMLERRIAGGALLKTWERSPDPVAAPGEILSDIGPCLTKLDPT
jgi:general secretion pathway protein K